MERHLKKAAEVDVNVPPNVTINKQIESEAFIWHENVTEIDLSGRNLILDEKVRLPRNLLSLNLAHNELVKVPLIVVMLKKLAILNLSHNKIDNFDDCPEFCHTLQHLDVSYNCLSRPPCWIWTETPQSLTHLDLSNNINITSSFCLHNRYFQRLLQCINNKIFDVRVENCKLGKYVDLLNTFPKVKMLCLGSEKYTAVNSLLEIPCKGIQKCSEVEHLIACNTNVYEVTPNIETYKNLVEINLAQNELSGLPNEFCNLENLEICVLSSNKIHLLPDDINKLQKLRQLYLDSNELCMLPDLSELLNLKTLDLYSNNLEEIPNFKTLEELDLALNYLEEPDDFVYLERKAKLRLLHGNRSNGRKEIPKCDNEESCSENEVDIELANLFGDAQEIELSSKYPLPSSPEDWESDSQWDPATEPVHHLVVQSLDTWERFVKQKMREGNFCPVDAHVESVEEKLKNERRMNPEKYVMYESDGQFDDCSGDSS